MKNKESFFWTGYSDLMTSVFFVMLLLFVLALAIIKKHNSDIIVKNRELEQLRDSLSKALIDARTTIEQQNRILKIDEQFQPLLESNLFIKSTNSRKFIVKDFIGQEIFRPNSSTIKNEYEGKTLDVGYALQAILDSISGNNSDFKYLVIIEGNVANTYDHRYGIDYDEGYITSYKRALAVYQYWRRNGINLRKDNTEVMICGSGWNGLDRDPIEDNNKRFTIQIIPKVMGRK